ncbi:MAG: hypothetical protein H6736_03805 [Alphaproteobacteria bacterium]|nr:hypothetical protein [Alphaproteobacteria bacterium]
MTGLLVLQLAHVLTGVIWAGGQVVTSVAVLPALLGLPAPRAREVLDALGSRLGPVMGLTGTTAMLLGIVRGAVYGPIRSFDVLLSTPYGQTFGLALVLSVLGAIHGARTEQRLAGLFEGDGYRPDARRRVLVDAVVVVGLMGGIVACMVAMHFGL